MKDILQEPDLKSSLRKEALARRDSIPLPVRKVKDSAIVRGLSALDKFIAARTVLLYASFRTEASTEDVIIKAIVEGKKVLLPKVNSAESRLDLYAIKSPEDLSPGYMGIPEPAAVEGNAAEIEDVELVIIPGAAFDPKGNRLGYGKGYYDRLLSKEGAKPTVVALAYEEQLLEDIPAEVHDVAVDAIITDRRTIYCKGSGNGQEEN